MFPAMIPAILGQILNSPAEGASMPDLIDLLIIGALLILILPSARSALRWARSMANPTARRVEDISGYAPPMSEGIAEAVRWLETQGFRLLGVSKTYIDRGEGLTWHLTSADGTITAEVVPFGQRGMMAQFTTTLEDDSVVETSCPVGERIRTATFRSSFAPDLEKAYDLHLREREEFLRHALSAPRRVTTMEQVLRDDRVYREKHFRRKFAPGLRRSTFQLVALLTAILAVVLPMFGIAPENPLLFLLIIAGIGAAGIAITALLINAYASR
ncbi:MAG: hypothetical protein Kow00124_29050 [Anaerolineae bacterium]